MGTPCRPAAVAGRFYPRDPATLTEEIRSFIEPAPRLVSALGCIVPHAGYIYSGLVAGTVFGALDLPQTCLVLCPNHTGRGRPLAIMSRGTWETPLGQANIDAGLADALKRNFPPLTDDAEAHAGEHAIEVQLPFLQVLRPGFSFVPIALKTTDFDLLSSLGYAAAEAIASHSGNVLIIASSDMNHYESDETTRAKDHKAIECILARDARRLFDVVRREAISMCGIGTAITMLTATECLGARHAELLKYGTSGDVSGDRRMVVGYAGVVVE